MASLDLEKCYDNVDTSLLYDLIEKLLYSDREDADDSIEEECSGYGKASPVYPSCSKDGGNSVKKDASAADTATCTRASISPNVRPASRTCDFKKLEHVEDEDDEEDSDDGYLVHKYSVAHYISRCLFLQLSCCLRVRS